MKRCLPILLILLSLGGLRAQGSSLGSVVNTPYAESRPLLTPDGQSLYFVRNEHPRNMGADNAADVWYAQRKEDGSWARPVNAGGPLNGPGADALVSVGPANTWLLRMNSDSEDGPQIIYREGRAWRSDGGLQVEGLDDWSRVETCFLGLQGQVLLLVMDNGRSGLDLFYSLPDSNQNWQAPVRIGGPLNTNAAEHWPVLAADGRTLYFASNRSGGQGNYDIWMSRRGVDWDDWSPPVNLGPDFNTAGEDSWLTIPAVGTYAIVTRMDPEAGTTDLYQIDLAEDYRPRAVTLVSGECRTTNGTHLPITLVYQATSRNSLMQEITIGRNGRYSLVIPWDESVHLSAQSPGFLSESMLLAAGGEEVERLDIDPNNTLASARLSAAYFQRDAEIEVLRLRLQSVNEEMLDFRSERETYLQELWDEKRRQGWTFRKEEWTDPEWQSLQDRYQRYLNEVLPTTDTVPANPDWQARAITSPEERQRREDQLAELEDMKRRFRQFHEEEAATEEAERNQRELEAYLWYDEAEPLAKINDQTNRQLADGLLPTVVEDISRQWVDDTVTEEEQSNRQQAAQSLQDEIRASLQARRPAAPTVPTWQEELREDMHQHIEPVVRERMTEDIRTEVRNALQAESSAQRNSTTANILEEELRAKVREQIREEEKQGVNARAPYPSGASSAGMVPQPAYRELETSLLLRPLEIGQVIVLENLIFEPNETRLVAAAFPELNRLAALFLQHPGLVVEFRGHTGTNLSHAMAMQLSAQRARTVVDYLVGQGVDRSRMSYRGYGKIAPLSSDTSNEAQLVNQRIELIILETN